MSNMYTENGWNIKLDVDLVSDPEYLSDFEYTPTGSDESIEYFLEEFGRDLAEANDPLRVSTLYASKTINQNTLWMRFIYTDDLEDQDNLDIIQRLPRIGLDMSTRQIPGTPLYLQSNTEYNYFVRKASEDSRKKEQGHRLDIHPRIYYPFQIGSYFDLEPSIGFRETVYWPFGIDYTWNSKGTRRNKKFNTRELYDAEFEASTDVARIFSIGGPNDRIQKLKTQDSSVHHGTGRLRAGSERSAPV